MCLFDKTMGSTRIQSSGINFRDDTDNANLELVVTSKGEGMFSCNSHQELVRLRSIGLTSPAYDDEYVTKSYVDAVATGLTMKGEVSYITVGQFPLSTLYTASTEGGVDVFTLQGDTPWMDLTTDVLDVESAANGVVRTLTEASSDVASGRSDWFGENSTPGMHLPFVARTHEFYYQDGSGNVSDNRAQRGAWPTRVLVNHQDNQKENGIYWLLDDGTTTGAWKLRRTSNFDGNPNGEIKPGAFVFVADGHVNRQKGFVLTNIDNAPSISVTTDGIDGNNVVFAGFSSAGNILAGANIAIDGETVATVMDPTFHTLKVGTNSHELTIDDFTLNNVRVARVMDSTGTCYFHNTVVKSSADIESLATLKSTLGIATGPTNGRTFTVNTDGTLIMKKNFTLDASVTSSSSNTVAMSLTNALFQISHFANDASVVKFKIEHDTGNTRTSGTLVSYSDTSLGTLGSNVATLFINASDKETTATGRLSVKDPASALLWLDVAKANGDTTMNGVVTIQNNLIIKDASASLAEATFKVTEATGDTLIKGKLTVNSSKFVVDSAAAYLVTIKGENAVRIYNGDGSVVSAEFTPGTSPVLSLKNDTDFKVFSTADSANPVFKVVGSSGATHATGDLSIGTNYTVTTSTGSVDMEGTLNVKGNATVETGGARVTAGSLKVGPANSECLVAYEQAHATELLTMRGNKAVRIQHTDGYDRFVFNAGGHGAGSVTGLLSLERGSQLVIKDVASNAAVFKCDGTGSSVGGAFIPQLTTSCNLTINDSAGGSPVLKFSVMCGTGNTLIKGTCTVHGYSVVKGTSLTGGVGMLIEQGGMRVLSSASGHELEVISSGTTQYGAETGSHTTYFKHRKVAGDRTDVEIQIGDNDGHGTVTVHGGVIDVVAPDATNKALSVQGNTAKPVITTYSEFQGLRDDASTKTYELDSQTGNLVLALGTFNMKPSWGGTSHTTISATGNATFKGATHDIHSETTIKGAFNLNLETGMLKMNTDRYIVTSTGATTQRGDLSVYDTSTAANSFHVTADGGAVVGSSSIHCVTSLSAAGGNYTNALFKVASSGATTLGSTLKVTGAATLHTSLALRNATDTADTCVITAGTGLIDTEGSVNVKQNVTVQDGNITVNTGPLNVQTVAPGFKFSVPTAAGTLGTFLGENGTLSLSVPSGGATIEHIMLSTGSLSTAAQITRPILELKEGGILRTRDTSGAAFLDVQAQDHTIVLGGVSAGTLSLLGSDGAGGTQANMVVDMATGMVQSQGNLAIYPTNAALVAGNRVTVTGTSFHVAHDTGNTAINGTLAVNKTTTIGTDSDTAHLYIPNGNLKVKATQFVVNGSNVARFENTSASDQTVAIYSNTPTKVWDVSANTGDTTMYQGANLQMRSAADQNTESFFVDGTNGNTKISGGYFAIKSQYSGDDTYTTFKVDKDGNTNVEGTMTIDKNTEITDGDLTIKQKSLYVLRDGNPLYGDNAPQYRFSVSSSHLGTFVAPDPASEGDKYFYIMDNSLAVRFKILGHTGDTSLMGGKFTVNNSATAFFTVDPEQNDSDPNTHGTITCRSLGANSHMLFKNSTSTVASIAMETGNFLTEGTCTLKGLTTVTAKVVFNTDAGLGVTTTMNYTGGTTFMKVEGESDRDMQLGPTGGGLAKLYLTCGGAITSHGGSLAIKNSTGTGSALFEVSGSTGLMTSRSGISLVNGGDLVIQDSSQVQKFAVTGSTGAVQGEGTVQIGQLGTELSPLWAVTLGSTGLVTVRNDLALTTNDNTKTRLLVSAATGNATLTGGNLTVMSDAATPVQKFQVLAATGNIASEGSLTIKDKFELLEGGASRVKIQSDGDIWSYGGDVFITDGADNVTPTITLDHSGTIECASNITSHGDGQVDGTFTCNSRCNALSFLATSDRTLKCHIRNITGDTALEMVSRLVGRTFEWKDPSMGTGERVGFIAQEVEEVHPALVHRDSSDGYYKVDYGSTTAILSNAIAELSRQILEMKEDHAVQIEALQSQVSTLQSGFQTA